MEPSYSISSAGPSSARHAYLTWTVVGLSVAITLFSWWGQSHALAAAMSRILAESPESVWAGRYDGLVLNAFVHDNVLHLAFNMLWLHRLGGTLERTVNRAAWVLVFILAAAVGSSFDLAVSGGRAIGASGVVYAMFGLLWAGRYYRPAWKEVATTDVFWLFVGWGVFCIALSAFGVLHIANGAHAGGFLFGLAAGWTLYARRRRRWSAAAIGVACLAVVGLSITWMPWSLRWTLWKADESLGARDYSAAVAHLRRSLPLGARPLPVWL
jgi:GlpG protein